MLMRTTIWQKCLYVAFLSHLGLNSTTIFAWGSLAHEAIAYIAEVNLTTEGRNFIATILPEPLPTAAVFSDQVRSDKRYQAFGPLHFQTIPESMPTQEWLANKQFGKGAHALLMQTPGYFMKSLKNTPTQLNPRQQELLLKYYIHVFADVHQPLHVGNEFDLGANLCQVYWTNPISGQTEEHNLHEVWDSEIFAYAKKAFLAKQPSWKKSPWFGYVEYTQLVLEQIKNTQGEEAYDALASSPPLAWYEESRRLARVAYPDAGEVYTAQNRPYCKRKNQVTGKIETGAFQTSKIPTLGETYSQNSLILANERVYLAGRRLAVIINTMALDSKMPLRDSGAVFREMAAVSTLFD